KDALTPPTFCNRFACLTDDSRISQCDLVHGGTVARRSVWPLRDREASRASARFRVAGIQAALVAIVVLSSAPHAHADDVKAKAKAHVTRATELHRESKFREALVELKTAYALEPDPKLLYAMGQIHVRLGECEQAIAFYERFLASKP